MPIQTFGSGACRVLNTGPGKKERLLGVCRCTKCRSRREVTEEFDWAAKVAEKIRVPAGLEFERSGVVGEAGACQVQQVQVILVAVRSGRALVSRVQRGQ